MMAERNYLKISTQISIEVKIIYIFIDTKVKKIKILIKCLIITEIWQFECQDCENFLNIKR